MSGIRTNAAAALLGVSPNTLRSWEARFGYPTPPRSEGGHRQFELAEIEALKQAFHETHDVAAAISLARERGEGPSTPARLCTAFGEFDAEKANRLIEDSLAVRSVERTVESVLLPAVEALAGEAAERRAGARASQAGVCPRGDSPEYGFAWRYATGWLAAALRVAPPASLERGVMIFDGSAPTTLDSLHVQTLELLARRAGWRVLALPVDLDSTRVGNALRALAPEAIVLAGRGCPIDAIGRMVYATRRYAGELPVLDFRAALPESGASTVRSLGERASVAVGMLRELALDGTAADARDRLGAASALASA